MPATLTPKPSSRYPAPPLLPERGNASVRIDGREIYLTNLDKPFWPELGVTKGDLLQYYAAVAPALLPHLCHRPMTMKRYPHGWSGDFFFMKRAPAPRPDWIRICPVPRHEGVIEAPIINDLASLLWVVNLGCIDLNPGYARCDDLDRPDYLHLDLDPVPGAGFAQVRRTALRVRETLEELGIPGYAKTTGSRGIHVYVPIHRGPTQKQVWTVTKAFAQTLERLHPELVTAEYRIAKRPAGRVLVDYNQNAWGRTLASVYSVRPTRWASVSTPVTWEELEQGVEIEDFTLHNIPDRLRRSGDLWTPLCDPDHRFDLAPLLP